MDGNYRWNRIGRKVYGHLSIAPICAFLNAPFQICMISYHCYNNLHTSGLSTRFLSVALGNFPFSHKTISEIRQCCPKHIKHLAFQFFPRRWLERCRLLEFFHSNLVKACLHGPCFVPRGIAETVLSKLLIHPTQLDASTFLLRVWWRLAYWFVCQASTYLWTYIVYIAVTALCPFISIYNRWLSKG